MVIFYGVRDSKQKRRTNPFSSARKNPGILADSGKFCWFGVEELLLQGLLNSNGHGDGHADHGVVASAQEASQAPLAVRKTPEIM